MITKLYHIDSQAKRLAIMIYYVPATREGGNKHCFCLSVRLSVRPLRTQRIIRERKGLSCPNLEGRFHTFDATSFKVKKLKKVKGQSQQAL